MKIGYLNFFGAGAMLSLVLLSAVHANAWDVNVDGSPEIGAAVFLSGGYRNDRIQSDLNFFNDEITISEDQKSKNLNIWEIGGKARAWYGNWVMRGEIFGGWGSSGHWNDNFSVATFDIALRGKLHKIKTLDGNIGAGYIFSFDDCYCNRWGVGPVAGWSYNRQNYKTKTVEINDFELDARDLFSFRQTWEGPWLGVDLFYKSPYLIAHLGYEYHWAQWKFRETFDTINLQYKSNKAHGNLAYFDLRYLFNPDPCSGGGWSIGLGLKYQEFKNRNSHTKSFGIPGFEAKVKKACWRSGEVTLDLGYKF